MFMSSLVINAQNCKQHKHFSTTNNCDTQYNGILNSATKRNELLIHATTSINIRYFRLS